MPARAGGEADRRAAVAAADQRRRRRRARCTPRRRRSRTARRQHPGARGAVGEQEAPARAVGQRQGGRDREQHHEQAARRRGPPRVTAPAARSARCRRRRTPPRRASARHVAELPAVVRDRVDQREDDERQPDRGASPADRADAGPPAEPAGRRAATPRRRRRRRGRQPSPVAQRSLRAGAQRHPVIASPCGWRRKRIISRSRPRSRSRASGCRRP